MDCNAPPCRQPRKSFSSRITLTGLQSGTSFITTQPCNSSAKGLDPLHAVPLRFVIGVALRLVNSRWVQTCRQEYLDHFSVFSEAHLRLFQFANESGVEWEIAAR